MSAADRVEAGLFMNPYTALFSIIIGSGAERTMIVVDAPALHFNSATVQAEPIFAVKRNAADTERDAAGIYHFPVS